MTQLALCVVHTQTLRPAIQTQNPIFMTSEDSWLELDYFLRLKSAKVHLISINYIYNFNSSQRLSCGQIKVSNFGVKDKL